MKTNLIKISNFLKMSKQKRNQNEQNDYKCCQIQNLWNDQIFFLKTTKLATKKNKNFKQLLDNLVLDLMHAILDSWLKIPKKMKADQKTYACTSMNEEKSKKSKVILCTACKSVARSQKEKE